MEDLHVKKEAILKTFRLINSNEFNQQQKTEVALLVNPDYNLPEDDSVRSASNSLMKKVITNYVRKVAAASPTLKQYKKGMKAFKQTGFVTQLYKRHFADVKAKYMLRVFSKDFASKLYSYGVSQLSVNPQALASPACHMTVYQLVPSYLHGSFIFKVI